MVNRWTHISGLSTWTANIFGEKEKLEHWTKRPSDLLISRNPHGQIHTDKFKPFGYSPQNLRAKLRLIEAFLHVSLQSRTSPTRQYRLNSLLAWVEMKRFNGCMASFSDWRTAGKLSRLASLPFRFFRVHWIFPVPSWSLSSSISTSNISASRLSVFPL